MYGRRILDHIVPGRRCDPRVTTHHGDQSPPGFIVSDRQMRGVTARRSLVGHARRILGRSADSPAPILPREPRWRCRSCGRQLTKFTRELVCIPCAERRLCESFDGDDE